MPGGVPLVSTANSAVVTCNCSCSGEERPVYARGSQSQSVFVGSERPPSPRQSVPSTAVQAKHRLLSTLACRVITSDWEPAREENWPTLLFQQVWITQPIPPPNTASLHLYGSCFAASLPSPPPEAPTPDPGGLLVKYAFNLSNTHGRSARNTHTGDSSGVSVG